MKQVSPQKIKPQDYNSIELFEFLDGEHVYELDNGLYRYQSLESFKFQNGDEISQLVLTFETYGKLNSDKSNVILINHAFSTDTHVASHPKNIKDGWWEGMIGNNKFIDTSKYYVICINNLGSCYGSSSPVTIAPNTDQPYLCNFPAFTIEDIVNSQKILFDFLKIDSIYAIVGPSLGGMISLIWTVKYPEMIEKLITISSSARAYTANNANRAIQREIIMLDPEWNYGNYRNNLTNGLNTARKLGLYTYRSSKEFNDRFQLEKSNNKPKRLQSNTEKIEKYLDYNANKFSSKFDANCYLYMLQAMDLYDVRNGYSSFHDALCNINADVLVISVNSDCLFEQEQQLEIYEEMTKSGISVEYVKHTSEHGHDAFLIETEILGKYIEKFISKAILTYSIL